MVMLVYDLRTVSSHAVAVDDVLPSTDADLAAAGCAAGGRGRTSTGRLSAAGPGRFFFSGEIQGTIAAECRRCLSAVSGRASASESSGCLPSPIDEGIADDPDVYVFDPRSNELDVRPAVREQWLLSAPAFVECRENCAGLCPTCGADLNAGPCGCEAQTDARWALVATRGAMPDGVRWARTDRRATVGRELTIRSFPFLILRPIPSSHGRPEAPNLQAKEARPQHAQGGARRPRSRPAPAVRAPSGRTTCARSAGTTRVNSESRLGKRSLGAHRVGRHGGRPRPPCARGRRAARAR